MSEEPSDEKKVEWQKRAAAKDAIVPVYFEVFPDKVIIDCGQCEGRFLRNLVPNVNDPTFICPVETCKARNWVPIRYKRSYY